MNRRTGGERSSSRGSTPDSRQTSARKPPRSPPPAMCSSDTAPADGHPLTRGCSGGSSSASATATLTYRDAVAALRHSVHTMLEGETVEELRWGLERTLAARPPAEVARDLFTALAPLLQPLRNCAEDAAADRALAHYTRRATFHAAAGRSLGAGVTPATSTIFESPSGEFGGDQHLGRTHGCLQLQPSLIFDGTAGPNNAMGSRPPSRTFGREQSVGDMSVTSALNSTCYAHREETLRVDDRMDSCGFRSINQYLVNDADFARGSQGTVMLVYDTVAQEERAMKIVPRPPVAGLPGRKQAEAIKRMHALRREVAIMRRISHKNIVRLYEVLDDSANHVMYLVMQFVDKGPLAHIDPVSLRCPPIPERKLTKYARQLCAGLTYLHERGICHLDVNPSNCLLGSNDQVYLLDFGISEIFHAIDEGGEEEGGEDESGNMSIGNGADLPLGPQLRRRMRLKRESRGTVAFSAPELLECEPTPAVTPKVVSPMSPGVGPMPRAAASSSSSAPQQQPVHKAVSATLTSVSDSASAAPTELTVDACSLDVFSLGVTLFVLLFGRFPYSAEYEARCAGAGGDITDYTRRKIVMSCITRGTWVLPGDAGWRGEEGDATPSAGWVELLRLMLAREPAHRPHIREVRRRVKEIDRRFEALPRVAPPPDPPTASAAAAAAARPATTAATAATPVAGPAVASWVEQVQRCPPNLIAKLPLSLSEQTMDDPGSVSARQVARASLRSTMSARSFSLTEEEIAAALTEIVDAAEAGADSVAPTAARSTHEAPPLPSTDRNSHASASVEGPTTPASTGTRRARSPATPMCSDLRAAAAGGAQFRAVVARPASANSGALPQRRRLTEAFAETGAPPPLKPLGAPVTGKSDGGPSRTHEATLPFTRAPSSTSSFVDPRDPPTSCD